MNDETNMKALKDAYATEMRTLFGALVDSLTLGQPETEARASFSTAVKRVREAYRIAGQVFDGGER